MRDFNTFVTISTGVRQRQNVQKSRARGGEVFLALRPIQPLYITASANYVDAKIVAGPAGTVIGQRVGRVPVQRENVRVTYSTPLLGALTVTGRHEGVTTTLQGVPLKPYNLVDAMYRREIINSVAGFIAIDNVADTKYQVALTAVLNGVASLGMPRTVRVGVDVTRF
jgi:outer membrane receptor protein involved in Fe transport